MITGSPLALWLGLAALLGTSVTAITIAALLSGLRPRLERLAPARRARVLTGLCLAPLLAGVALAFACLLPSLYAAGWPALDHCTRHADEHLHLCLIHAPVAAIGLPALLVGAAIMLFALSRGVRVSLCLVRANRVLERLRMASMEADPGVRTVDSDAVFSFTGGLLRSDIYLSRGLREHLNPTQLAAVLAHEQAHVHRRDILRRHAAQLGALLHLPGAAESLLAALELACEEACDASAAAKLGDPVEVAQAIVAVARLKPRPPPALAASVVGFTADALTHRVTALLAAPQREPTVSRWIFVVALVALAFLAPALHHATETVLSLLAN